MMKFSSPLHWLNKSAKKIIKICQYIPLLWRDEDWDWHFILVLLRYKLNRTSNCIRKNDVIADHEQDLIEKQIGVVVKLLERVEKNQYGDWLERNIQRKYCENFMAYMPKDSVMYELMFDSGPEDYDTRFTAEEKEDIQEMWRLAYEAADRMRSRDISRAMRIMAKHIQYWWD